ncbi:MAG TPA: response regulator [Thermoanaerobaculia bacterium]|nr:response regulator [Thermoanaerobaculia bacterium]
MSDVRVRSLRVRFVLAISALVALVLVANGMVLALAGRPHLREDIERRAQAYARLSVGPICNAYETYYASGYSKFRELVLETMRLDPDLARLALYDTSGRVLFDSSEFQSQLMEPTRSASAVTSDPAMREAVKGLSLSAWKASEDGKPVYVVVAPFVEEWGRHRYSVVFYVVYDSLAATARAAVRQIFWLSAGSLGLGVLIAVLLAAQILGPLEALTRGAQDLADGRLERRIDLEAGDELGVLAVTFNQMAEKLSRTISDLEASNRALGQMNLELQQLDHMKSDLLANVSHELRTPLTAIQGYTEAMDEGLLGQVNAQQRDAFKVVQRNTRRLMGMIEQLLGFSRLEAGIGKLDCTAFDLGEVAAQVTAQVAAGVRAGPGSEHSERSEELDLRLDVEPGLPLVWGDPGRISQVIENLVTNAVKFSPPGGEIRVSLRRRGEEVEVAVADRGIGIPKAAQPLIFERFYQVDTSSTRRYGGMGLGLAIVREILAAHQREIGVESAVGAGTTFRFSLPLALPAGAAGAAGGAGAPGAAGAAAAAPAAGPEDPALRRVVLIDDDPGFAHLLEEFLGRAGFAVETAPTARAGFDRVAAARPDLVLLDRLLPDGDGFDLLSRLQRDDRTARIPVLVVSIRKERALGLRLGASGYLVKPVAPARVKELILETLGQPAGAPEVLVADDDDDLRRLLVDRLQADGLRARGAAGGGEALQLIADRPPALLLLDLMMPDLDGWEVLRRLRADPATADLPVIVLSARSGALDRAAAEGLKVVDFVGKPFDLGSLLDEIERTLGPASRQEGLA